MYPCRLLRNMQKFTSDEYMNIIMSESGCEMEEIMHLEKNQFIRVVLRMHQADSSGK